MAPLELDGENLGKKHQNYNKLLKHAIENHDNKFTLNFKGDGDINNLLQIDVACANRNVEFIFEVFKCGDDLYISKAIKRSTWLITDPSYAHIINIDYLKKYLFPYMTTKAINKLMLSIRLNIKDEKRAEAFFDYEEKKNLDMALKWLPNCSLPFIDQAVAKHKDSISKVLLKRLCKKSISVLEVYLKNKDYVYADTLVPTLFLIKYDAERYLEIIKDLDIFQTPPFGRKYTEILMKKCPQKILDNFEKLSNRIDYSTCAKYMNKEDIKPFLLKQAANEKMSYFMKYGNVKHFLNHMPREGRFEFIKQMFMNNEKIVTSVSDGLVPALRCEAFKSSNSGWGQPKNVYDWYIFAPFDVAFHDLKKLMRLESSPDERNSMLAILLHCAGRNKDNIHTLLQYYYEKHVNEPFKFKIKFVEKVLKNVKLMKDPKNCQIINRLFHSMEVFIESTNNVQKCIETIIINNAINDIPNPKIVEEKFTFNTLKPYKNKLQFAEKEKVFNYLFNHLHGKICVETVTNEISFNVVMKLIKTILELINDWGKNLNDYPVIIKKIKELVLLKKEQSWNTNLMPLYHINKSWRRCFFEESLVLWPSETVCINALKHDPSLLSRYNNEIQKICCNDTMSLRILLSKLRVYWPLSLATEWNKFLLQQIDNASTHKTVIKALMIIAPSDQITNIIKKYEPDDSKINWGATDDFTLSVRKCIARKMYLSRPPLPTDLVLLYAKGDYLQYTVPSLSSILFNLSSNESGPIVRKLLTAPVSLQKYAIRLAFAKLDSKELRSIFSEAWKSTNNATIRTVLFEKTHHALCAKANITVAKELWELLSDFINNLSYKENKKIYNILGEVSKVPSNIRGKFYMKSYTFLKSMPTEDFIENILHKLINIVPSMMEQLDMEFVANVMLKDVDENFTKSRCTLLSVISTNALFCNDEVTQTKRFERIIGPLMDRHLPAWNTIHENKKYVCYNIENLLKSLVSYMDEVFLDRNKVIPIKMFRNIQSKLENSLSVKENYVFITTWKLITAFTELIDTNRESLPFAEIDNTDCMDSLGNYKHQKYASEKMNEVFTTIIPLFAKVCTDNLKVDVNKYFPSIYLMYGQAVYNMLQYFNQYYKQFLLYKHMLSIDKSTENFLLVINYCTLYPTEDQKDSFTEIRTLLEAHPSAEIQMHCVDKFSVLYTTDI